MLSVFENKTERPILTKRQLKHCFGCLYHYMPICTIY